MIRTLPVLALLTIGNAVTQAQYQPPPRGSNVSALAAVPTIDCAPLTYAQAQTWADAGLCLTPPQGLPQTTAPEAGQPSDDECASLNPYVDGDLAARCAARPLPSDSVPAFRVGHVYAFGYRQLTAQILAVTQDADGVQIVVYRWLPESGNAGLRADRTPPTAGGTTQWFYVGPAGSR